MIDEAVQVVGRLEDAAVFDAAPFTVAEPAFRNARLAAFGDALERGRRRAVFGVEPSIQRGIQRAVPPPTMIGVRNSWYSSTSPPRIACAARFEPPTPTSRSAAASY